MNFGFPSRAGYGATIAVLGVHGALDVGRLLRAVEAGLRGGMASDPRLEDYRRQLLNMRFRAWLEDWRGWE